MQIFNQISSVFIVKIAFEVQLATKAAKAILQDLSGSDSKDERCDSKDFKTKLAAFYDVIPLPGEALDFFARTPTAILQEGSLCWVCNLPCFYANALHSPDMVFVADKYLSIS